MKKKIKKKQIIVYSLIGILVVNAILSVGAVIVSVSREPEKTELPPETADAAEAKIKTVDDEMKFPLEDLQPEIEKVIEDVKQEVGGEWSVYIVIPKTGDTLSINQKKMQSASVIKLCVMCTVYEEYDELKKEY